MPDVLLVENDEHLQKLYERELIEEGYTVWLAQNGKDAINLVRRQRPDVAVLEMHMPGMDGLETLTRLLEVARTLRLIIYTAHGSHEDRLLSWAADAYLTKSSDLKPLKDTIQRLLPTTSYTSREATGESNTRWHTNAN